MSIRGDALHRINKLAGIVGRWKFEADGRALCEGPEVQPTMQFGLCVSNERFLEGEAKVTVRKTDGQGPVDGRILFGYRSMKHEHYTIGLHAEGRAYQIVRYDPTLAGVGGWYVVEQAGLAENLDSKNPFRLRVLVRGQLVSLEVNDVRVLESVVPTPLPYGQLGLFSWLSKGGGVEFEDLWADSSKGDAFVVMQLSGFEKLYTDVIVPVTKEFGLHAYNANEVYGPGSIMEDVIKGIETAQVIIAEITPSNENVYYEIGYAHALKKPTILLVDKGVRDSKKLPFDLSDFRCLFYENSIGGKHQVVEGLRKHLQAILGE